MRGRKRKEAGGGVMNTRIRRCTAACSSASLSGSSAAGDAVALGPTPAPSIHKQHIYRRRTCPIRKFAEERADEGLETNASRAVDIKCEEEEGLNI